MELSWLAKLLDRASRSFAFIAGIAIVLMMVQVNLDVFGKYLFNMPIPGTIEITSNWYMVAIVFLPLAAVERRDAHIAVELLTQHLGERANAILTGCVSLLAALYFGAFAWRTWGDALVKYELGEYQTGDISVIIWPTRFFIPLGCGLITLLLVWKGTRLLQGRRTFEEMRKDAIGD